jgi:hypothetical protein
MGVGCQGGQGLFSPSKRPDRLGAHPAFYPICIARKDSPGSNVADRVLLATRLHLVPGIRVCGGVPKLLHTSFRRGVQLCIGTIFVYSLIFSLKLFVREATPVLQIVFYLNLEISAEFKKKIQDIFCFTIHQTLISPDSCRTSHHFQHP